MTKRILVIGGTGMLGRPVAHRLNEDGYRVRIMTRDRAKAAKLFDGSFEVVTGNPTEFDCLEQALRGCRGAHISLPTEVELPVAEAVAKRAAAHGLERISYISGATVAEENRWFPMIERKLLAEQALRGSGVPSTVFCPTWVMESLPMFVREGRAAVLGRQPFPYRWVAAADLAGMVSTAFGLAAAAGRRFLVLGPEPIRMHAALGLYCAVFHPGVRKVGMLPFWLVRVLAALTRNPELRGAGELMAYFERIGERCGGADPAGGILAAPSTTLDAWLQKRKASEE